jgi:hypothetical protein
MASRAYLEEHGGECCGRRHIWGFENIYSENLSFKDKIKAVLISFCGSYNCERVCLEIVLTAEQTRAWQRAVVACGFKKVHSFVNGNTGNTCHVFMTDMTRKEARAILTKRKISF